MPLVQPARSFRSTSPAIARAARTPAAMTRAALAIALLAVASPTLLAAQAFTGAWEVALQGGNHLSVVLTQSGRRVTGSLVGASDTFAIDAEVAADGGFYGTAKSAAGSLFIGGEREGDVLLLALAELTAAGMPDLTRAQELRLERTTEAAIAVRRSAGGGAQATAAPAASAPAASVPAASAPASGRAPAPPAASSSPATRAPESPPSLGRTPMDQQVAQLLVSSPWCHLQYSQQMGATTTERVVFQANGRVAIGTDRESAVNNQHGVYYGRSNTGQQGHWRVENGALMLSEDGRSFAPTTLAISRNSNGYPIVTANGKEYYQCN